MMNRRQLIKSLGGILLGGFLPLPEINDLSDETEPLPDASDDNDDGDFVISGEYDWFDDLLLDSWLWYQTYPTYPKNTFPGLDALIHTKKE